MKEIKYQAYWRAKIYNAERKDYDDVWIMSDVHSLHLNKNKVIVSNKPFGNQSIEVGKDCFLRHFTGLYDDYGNEIYEGDIVEVYDPNETTTIHISEVWIDYDGIRINAHPVHKQLGVRYSRNLKDYCDYGFGEGLIATCKILGNKFENGEILSNEN